MCEHILIRFDQKNACIEVVWRKDVRSCTEVNIRKLIEDLINCCGVYCAVCVYIKDLTKLGKIPNVKLCICRSCPGNICCLTWILYCIDKLDEHIFHLLQEKNCSL